MKRNLTIYFLLVFAFLLLGAATMAGEFIALSVIFLVLGITSILTRPEAPQLRFERRFSPTRIRQDVPLNITLKITNLSEKRLNAVSIADILPRGIEVLGGDTRLLTTLEPEESAELSYTIRARRGQYRDFVSAISAYQTLDGYQWNGRREDETPLLVYPQSEKLSPFKIYPPQTHGFAGSIAARRAGSGVDFFTIREYQSGDPQRHINWKASNRSHQRLYTNIFEQEQVANVGIILDARQRINLRKQDESLFEHSVNAAAALSERFIADGHRVSLLIYGSGKRRVFPGYGRLQERRILDAIAAVAPVINFALTNFDSLPVQFFPPKSQIVIVSPILEDDIPYIRKMCMRGYGVLVVSPNPVKLAAGEDTTSSAYRIANAERAFMIQQLRRIGAQVIDWDVTHTLESTIQRAAFSLQGHQRTGRGF
ncbi:MAG: DUF58 domain-containing protein [Anaerolineae bacterium]|jgi:uncharacterized protein (DUF58 family)|nr:DUF58 domain-containing protein [Anaerolineae bacterium]